MLNASHRITPTIPQQFCSDERPGFVIRAQNGRALCVILDAFAQLCYAHSLKHTHTLVRRNETMNYPELISFHYIVSIVFICYMHVLPSRVVCVQCVWALSTRSVPSPPATKFIFNSMEYARRCVCSHLCHMQLCITNHGKWSIRTPVAINTHILARKGRWRDRRGRREEQKK